MVVKTGKYDLTYSFDIYWPFILQNGYNLYGL